MSSPKDRWEPTEVRAPMGARVMEIAWADGRSTGARHLLLRAFCPCAHCQGHQGPVRWALGPEGIADDALEITEIEPVGHYALRLVWGDGHQTGIYTFRHLREIGELGDRPVEELKDHQFGR